ncbi:MAG: UDP-N-acetylmuramoyl-L-alanyl-D-glutamate--2,6-diaminopimelate ligase [Gammaproteobacteria bacterium]|nr:UDP-N-acetylmuramoyl-L-alanyl-D-glutamate--2,6-diaminopimelate ligase [Gammaproteobacteria bacterium]
MQLSFLLQDICSISIEIDCSISGLSLDSRQIKPGDLFFAMKGAHVDGHHYILDAMALGASAVLIEAQHDISVPSNYPQTIPIVPIKNLSEKIGFIAARFYDYPANKLRMIGVTGTSGKTSCTHFIAQLLQLLQIPCGLIGTLGSGFLNHLTETGLTTPDALTLHSSLHTLCHAGAEVIAMEVSSHSIDQGRINGIPFEVGIFTNLSQDHLDYHGDMQTYANVKKRFLAELPTQHIVLNADDHYGSQWISELSLQKSVFVYSLQQSLSTLPAHLPVIGCRQIKTVAQGITADIYTPWGEGPLFLPLIGQFNLSNALAALTALCILGVPLAQILNSLSQLQAVPGRMQTLGGENKPVVVVDYAHKPDALAQVLKTLRAHTKGQLWCVFGCGGERDRGKRPLMASIAEQWADRVIVTNDNPRHENPEEIVADIVKGFTHPERVAIELNRSKAIENCIQWAKAGDCILIAGKGAEHYQQIGDVKLPFDDVEHANHCLLAC